MADKIKTLIKQYFSKKSGCQSSAGAEILAYISYCSAKFEPILDSFIPNLKLKYKDTVV